MKMPVLNIPSKGARFNLLCMMAALLTYMSMYAFRKLLSAATFEGITYWGLDYKIIAIISQVVGYTCSKFLGITIVSSMKPQNRIRCILGFIAFAWVALLMFALVPHPYNVVFLVLNGLPLGMIFVIVISFLEGRRNTELLGAGLCVSFITASGITKAVGRFLIIHFHVSDFWMPFCTGLVFVPVLLLGVWMLSLIPPQSEEDKASRSERTPMGASERMKFFRSFSWGVILSTLTYATQSIWKCLCTIASVTMTLSKGNMVKNSLKVSMAPFIIHSMQAIPITSLLRCGEETTVRDIPRKMYTTG